MREAGILLPVFSLPSSGGVGTMGKGAVRFVDFLASAGQKWWQVLPLGPTGYGNSPYQSFSAFAGNPYLIDVPMAKTYINAYLNSEEAVSAAISKMTGKSPFKGRYSENVFCGRWDTRI